MIDRVVNCLKIFILLLFVMSVLASGAAGAEEQELTVIFTNDIHGNIIESKAHWVDSDSTIYTGGFPRFATYLSSQRSRAERENRPLIYLDGGDFLSGTPESDILSGRPLIAALNLVGLDYTVFGNHEVDLGIENLKKRIAGLDAEVLASNLRYKDEDRLFPGTIELAVEEMGGLRVGFFGLINEKTPGMAVPERVEDLIFLPEVETARRMIERLREKEVDLIIAVNHLGLERDRRLARKVSGIDVIVGGHSHDLLWKPVLVDSTVIVQAGGRLRNAGRLDLKFKNGELTEHNWELATLYEDRYPPDTRMAAVFKPYLEEAKEFLYQIVGRTSGSVERYVSQTSPLGNLITNIMREKLKADFAFMNPMGVLKSLPEGEITRRDLMRAVRYGNYLVKLELTGSQIRRIFERSLRYPDRLIQFSGGTVKINPARPRGQRTGTINVAGEQLQEEKTYTVATSNFVAARPIFRAAKSRTDHPDLILWQVLEEYFQNHQLIEPPYANRYKKSTPAFNPVN